MTQIHVTKDGVTHHKPYALDRTLFARENKVEIWIKYWEILVTYNHSYQTRPVWLRIGQVDQAIHLCPDQLRQLSIRRREKRRAGRTWNHFFCLNYFLDPLPFSHAYKGDPDPLIFPHNYLIAFMWTFVRSLWAVGVGFWSSIEEVVGQSWENWWVGFWSSIGYVFLF